MNFVWMVIAGIIAANVAFFGVLLIIHLIEERGKNGGEEDHGKKVRRRR